MKKIFKFCALLLSVALLLTACGSEEKTKVYTETSNNQEHVSTIYYKGDTVNKVITVSTLNNNISNLDSALETAKKSFLKKPNFDGYTRSAEIKDGKIVLTTETDYNKLDFETYRGRIHLSDSATLENERKLSNVENNLKKEGATEKK